MERFVEVFDMTDGAQVVYSKKDETLIACSTRIKGVYVELREDFETRNGRERMFESLCREMAQSDYERLKEASRKEVWLWDNEYKTLQLVSLNAPNPRTKKQALVKALIEAEAELLSSIQELEYEKACIKGYKETIDSVTTYAQEHCIPLE